MAACADVDFEGDESNCHYENVTRTENNDILQKHLFDFLTRTGV